MTPEKAKAEPTKSEAKDAAADDMQAQEDKRQQALADARAQNPTPDEVAEAQEKANEEAAAVAEERARLEQEQLDRISETGQTHPSPGTGAKYGTN